MQLLVFMLIIVIVADIDEVACCINFTECCQMN